MRVFRFCVKLNQNSLLLVFISFPFSFCVLLLTFKFDIAISSRSRTKPNMIANLYCVRDQVLQKTDSN